MFKQGKRPINDELLVSLISANPCIYNKKLKEYRDVYQKENVWNFIASSLAVTKEEAKNRWTSLRQRFSREKLVINEETRSGAAGGKKPRWSLYELMRFLEEHVITRSTVSNMSLENNSEVDGEGVCSQVLLEEEYEETPNSDNTINILSVVPASESESSSTFTRISTPEASPLGAPNTSLGTPTNAKKKKVNNDLDSSINNVKECIINWQKGVAEKNKTIEESPEASFAKFIAHELNNFKNMKNKDGVKGKICELIFKYKNIEEDINL
ncbi:hypothetical protein RI129_007243 [Pyrocoelia pectoralis]|uniref:MADF domain-containing protein n=1 Tax=Pyrocoelia pectoralis TaxID=417401 RepID=A0AAN7VDQ1_9COLE